MNTNKKPLSSQINGKEVQSLHGGTVNDSQPHNINVEREMETIMKAQNINGSVSNMSTSEGANLLEGLLPPIIKATGSLVAGGA